MTYTATQSSASNDPAAPPNPAVPSDTTSTLLPIGALDPNPWNTRRFPAKPDEADRSLTASIRAHGVLENLLVRPMPDNRYQIVFGARRLRCAHAAGLTHVPALIREVNDHEARVLTVTENLQREDLHFLDEAEGIAGLFAEGWTLDMVASKLGKARTWVARRKHLLSLTLTWSRLAREPQPWMNGWSPAHFEHIATLAPEAQEHILETESHRLQRCVTAGDLAKLTGSLTLGLKSFPWNLDDQELDPEAGACTSCPHRSSQNPGLFDNQEADPPPPSAQGKRRASTKGATDRCLNPHCAARKGNLFVAQKTAALAKKHPTVLTLHDDWGPCSIPGALHVHNVEMVTQRTAGAVPAVIASGAHLGAVRWVLQPAHRSPHQTAQPEAQLTTGKKPLAQRKANRDRQRKILALDLLRNRLLDTPAPELTTCIRLAVVFGTYQSHRSSGSSHDPSLPRLLPGATAALVSRHMLAALRLRTALPTTHTNRALSASDPEGSSGIASLTLSGESTGLAATATANRAAEPADHPDVDDSGDSLDEDAFRPSSYVSPAQLWQTFDALDETYEPLYATLLWARTLPVLVSRLTPSYEGKNVQPEWDEAERITRLLGLDLHALFDLAVAKLPDPKAWAAEEAALAKALATATTSSEVQPPPKPTRRQAAAATPRRRKAASPAEPPAAA